MPVAVSIYTINNIRERSLIDNPVKYSRVIEPMNKWNTYKLENDFVVQVHPELLIEFKKGFTWDLASIPRIFHWLMRPSGSDDIAYLIHDWLYKYKITSRKLADDIMLDFAIAMKRTSRWSLRNLDIYTRYYVVRVFGGFVWKK